MIVYTMRKRIGKYLIEFDFSEPDWIITLGRLQIFSDSPTPRWHWLPWMSGHRVTHILLIESYHWSLNLGWGKWCIEFTWLTVEGARVQ